MGSFISKGKKIGLKRKAKVNGIAFTQWDGTIYWDKVGVISEIDLRNNPQLSLKKWMTIAKNDKSLPDNIQNLSKKLEKDRNNEEKEILKSHFINYIYAKAPKDILSLRGQVEDLNDQIKKMDSDIKTAADAITNYKKTFRSMLVSQSGNKRMVRILPRGNWLDESGEVVDPAIPEFLGKLELENRKANRLDLAKWVVSKDNPLPRSSLYQSYMENLFWIWTFAPRLEDLGGQGEPPTHPKLLDHLSLEFRNNGWDIKKLIRSLVTSDAYKQSSIPSEKLAKEDPLNRLYARQSRFRLDAEFVRDSALSISGLLIMISVVKV